MHDDLSHSFGTAGNPAYHVFFQRVKLLAVMAKAFADDHPMGFYRKKALEDNLEQICEEITFNQQLFGKEFLKVA